MGSAFEGRERWADSEFSSEISTLPLTVRLSEIQGPRARGLDMSGSELYFKVRREGTGGRCLRGARPGGTDFVRGTCIRRTA